VKERRAEAFRICLALRHVRIAEYGAAHCRAVDRMRLHSTHHDARHHRPRTHSPHSPAHSQTYLQVTRSCVHSSQPDEEVQFKGLVKTPPSLVKISRTT
jgi:hypothetical protein